MIVGSSLNEVANCMDRGDLGLSGILLALGGKKGREAVGR